MNEVLYRFAIASGAGLALIGAFVVASSLGAIDAPYRTTPECEDAACPDKIWVAYSFVSLGTYVIVLGLGIVGGAVAIGAVSRINEEVLLERIERRGGVG